MAIFVLRDPIYGKEFSRVNNFNLEWMRWFGNAISIPFDTKISANDILIYGIHHGNPFDKYTIPNKCKKIAIVHSITDDTLKYIEDANYVIYLNPFMQKMVTNIAGIRKAMKICPHYPTRVTNGVQFNLSKLCYVGGWFNQSKAEQFLNKIESIYSQLPPEIPLAYFPIWSDHNTNEVNAFVDTLKRNLTNNKTISNRNFIVELNKAPYDVFSFRTHTAYAGCIFTDAISVEEAFDRLQSSDSSLLNVGITESSMLAHFNNPLTKMFVDNTIDFISYKLDRTKFNYKDFSAYIQDIISKIV